MTLVEQVWKKLDEDMLSLMQPEANTDFVALKARLRAFAEVLAIFMVPHFRTADEVAREAKRRYDNRLNSEYCTPGLEQLRYAPPPGTPDKYTPEPPKTSMASPRASRTSAATATERALSKISDETKAQIKHFANNGFPVAVLAKTHGVSEAVINAVISA